MNTIIISNENGEITDLKTLGHIHTVLKSKIGDILRVGVLNKNIYMGRISSLSQDYCKLELESQMTPLTPWVNLIVGLSRPQTSKKIMEHATTFGVKKFHFYKAELSEKSYLDSKIFESDAYQEYFINGLSQSGHYTTLPNFILEKYNPSSLYKIIQGQKFILDLNANKSFSDYSLDFSSPITLAFGPERGFTKNEILEFHEANFQSVKISKSILRVEHAVYASLAQLEMLKGV